MNIRPMSPFLGAEIEGVNLCGALSSEMYAAINNALLEHIVVIIRDQKLSPKAYVEVMSQFGVPGKQSHEYRKDKRPFHPSPTADNCCCTARQLCNTSPESGRYGGSGAEIQPLLATIDPSGHSSQRIPAAVAFWQAHFSWFVLIEPGKTAKEYHWKRDG